MVAVVCKNVDLMIDCSHHRFARGPQRGARGIPRRKISTKIEVGLEVEAVVSSLFLCSAVVGLGGEAMVLKCEN
jgi:hypothetical protein